jgi:hypothetical protein
MIELSNRLRRKDKVISHQIEGKEILLRLDSGEYYALDEVGRRIWELCDGTRSVGEVVATVSEEYDAPEDTIRADAVELLQNLLDEKLVHFDGGT